MIRTAFPVLLCCSTLLTVSPGGVADSHTPQGVTTTVVDVPTRGVTDRILYVRPHAPVANVVVLPGGELTFGIQDDGTMTAGPGACNPVARNRFAYAQHNYALALVDRASDGQIQRFEDVHEIVRYMRSRANVPTWVIGGSASSPTTIEFAADLPLEEPLGVIDFGADFGFFFDTALAARIERPTLVIYHQNDTANIVSWSNRLFDALTSAPVRERVVITGGTDDSCGYHLFEGRDAEFVAATSGFIDRNNEALASALPQHAAHEAPAAGSVQSGVGLIRGWACRAQRVSISLDGGENIPIAWGTSRADTRNSCGDSDNGYGMVIAWGLLGNGTHRMQTFADDRQIADSQFEVVALGNGFVTGLHGEYVLGDFPASGQSVRVTWSEADQNFIVTGVNTGQGFGPVRARFSDSSPTGRFEAAEQQAGGAMHESPAQHSIQSGVGLIRGWACRAGEVTIAIDDGTRIPIAHGTARADTGASCGDTDNGYGMVIAWGLLGNGLHHLHTFVDGVEIANVEFEVVAIGNGFVTGLQGEYRLADFPAAGKSVEIRWSEADQNFRIVRIDD